MARLVLLLLLLALPLAAGVTHTFDLASKMPNTFAVMFSMSWFGITKNDPQGAGTDPTWVNWQWGGGCIGKNDPTQCNTDVTSTPQRWVASNFRPLCGIYSASGLNAESRSRIDLMLSTIRRPNCDTAARIDVWSVQQSSMHFTSLHTSNPAPSCQVPYDALLNFIAEANLHNIHNAIMPGVDGTWLFHFGGMSSTSAVMAVMAEDLADMVKIALNGGPAIRRINGLPVIYVYLDSSLATVAEWHTALDTARNLAGSDFYAIASTADASFFAAFDAISPWVNNLGWWSSSKIQSLSTYEAKGAMLAQVQHEPLLNALSQYPGRVVLGGASPGFDDYTKDWGQCKDRVIPRDPGLMKGQFDYYASQKIRGFIFQTWDDWTEGTRIEPDVVGGSSVLLQCRQLLGSIYGETADPAGDSRLTQRWATYGQMRNCNGKPVGTPPVVSFTCPNAPPPPTTSATATTTTGTSTTAPPAPPASYAATVLATPGLKAYYRLSETSGSTAADQLKSHPGQISATGVTFGVSGAIHSDPSNTALGFNGGGVTIPNVASSVVNGPISIEAWVKTTGGAGWGGVAGFRTPDVASGQVFYVNIVSATSLELRFIDSVAAGAQLSPAITSGVWHHLVLTYDGSRTLAAFVDGKAAGSTTATGAFTASTLPFLIGVDGNGNHLLGAIDEVALYNVALSASTVAAHYAAAIASAPPPPPSYAATIEGTSGLLAYFRLDEASGLTAHDITHTNVVGTISGSVTLAVSGALVNDADKAMQFSGGSVLVPKLSAALVGKTKMSLEAWVSLAPKPAKQWGSIMGFRTTTESFYINTVAYNTQLEMRFVGSGAAQQVGPAITPSTWHHVALVYDGSKIYGYLDGNLAGSGSASGSLTDGTISLGIGTDGTGNELSGVVDEAAVYTVALSASQVASHYAIGHGTASGTGSVASLSISLTGKKRGAATVITPDFIAALVQNISQITGEPVDRFTPLPLAPAWNGLQQVDIHISSKGQNSHGAVANTIVQYANTIASGANVLSASSAPAPASQSSPSSSLSPGAIAGIVVACCAVLAGVALALAAVFYLRHHKARQPAEGEEPYVPFVQLSRAASA